MIVDVSIHSLKLFRIMYIHLLLETVHNVRIDHSSQEGCYSCFPLTSNLILNSHNIDKLMYQEIVPERFSFVDSDWEGLIK